MKRDVKRQTATPGSIRIISGQWRGRKLPVLDVNGLRPTTDRTKETLFNWLMPYIRGSHCLDAFAGSGGLGFEALSRYAENVVFVEKDKKVSDLLKTNLKTLNVSPERATVLNEDAMHALPKLNKKFDLVFLDPPFNKQILPECIKQLSEADMLNENALIYVECEVQNSDFSVPDSWQCLREKSTRQVVYRLYQAQ